MKILSLKEKTTRYISNNFTILNRDYNTWRIPLEKKKNYLLLFTHFLTVYLPQFSLILYIFLFSLLLALTHTALQDCNVLNLTHGDLSSSPLHQMAEWSSLYFFIFSFFSSFQHASHQITINASTLALTFVHDIDIRQKG